MVPTETTGEVMAPAVALIMLMRATPIIRVVLC
ncbi:hypothetical protein N183_32745 [Sinorhizobium sp. Sb3]|nr:hypothetical protein N183_32745 [Sinorhizobium sp. Sb3]